MCTHVASHLGISVYIVSVINSTYICMYNYVWCCTLWRCSPHPHIAGWTHCCSAASRLGGRRRPSSHAGTDTAVASSELSWRGESRLGLCSLSYAGGWLPQRLPVPWCFCLLSLQMWTRLFIHLFCGRHGWSKKPDSCLQGSHYYHQEYLLPHNSGLCTSGCWWFYSPPYPLTFLPLPPSLLSPDEWLSHPHVLWQCWWSAGQSQEHWNPPAGRRESWASSSGIRASLPP